VRYVNPREKTIHQNQSECMVGDKPEKFERDLKYQMAQQLKNHMKTFKFTKPTFQFPKSPKTILFVFLEKTGIRINPSFFLQYLFQYLWKKLSDVK